MPVAIAVFLAMCAVCALPITADAQCAPDSATALTGDVITCTGVDADGFVAGAGVEDLKITIEAGATVETTVAGTAAIEINSNNPGDLSVVPIIYGVINRGRIEFSGDGSAGIRGAGPLAEGEFNLIRNQAVIDGTGSTSTDTIGIDMGDDADVRHFGDILLRGDRGIGIRVGDDASVASQGEIRNDLADAGADVIGIEMGDRATLSHTGTIQLEGIRNTGVLAGDDAGISVEDGGVIRVEADGAIGVLVGADSRVTIDGRVDAFGEDAIGVFMGNQVAADPNSMLMVTGVVQPAFEDSIAVSLGSKTAEAGVTLENSTTPSMQIGRLSTTATPADPGTIFGTARGGPLVVFRSETSDLNHLVVGDDSLLAANEALFFEENRAIAIQGTAGRERIDNYGTIRGKVLLEGGDDIFVIGPGGEFVGDMSVSGGSGVDRLELANSMGFDHDGSVTDVDLENYRQFESLRLADAPYRLRGSFSGASPGATVRVENAGTLVISEFVDVGGDITFGPDATLAIELSAVSTATPLSSNGSVTIEGTPDDMLTTTLDLSDSRSLRSGEYLLVSSSALSGEFEQLLLPRRADSTRTTLEYDSAGGTLTLQLVRSEFPRNREVTDLYTIDLQLAMPSTDLEAALDSLYQLPSDEYALALDQLHPEPYDAQTSVQLALAREFDETMLERPSYCIAPTGSGKRDRHTKVPCRPRALDVWATGYGLFRRRDGKEGQISWSDDGGGVVLGIDHRRGDSLLLTAALGGARANSDVDAIGRGRFSSLDAGALAAWTMKQLLVQGFVSYGHGWHQVNRNIDYADVTRTSEADYESNRIGLGGDLAWTFALDGLDLTPSFEVDWARVMRPSFTENGAAPLNLAVVSTNDSVTTIRVGLEAGRSLLKKGYWTDFLESTDGVWRPSISIKWRQVVAGSEREYTSSIVGAPGGSGRTTVIGDDASQGFEVGAGLWFTPKGATRLTFGASYDAFVWKDIVSHDFNGTVAFSF